MTMKPLLDRVLDRVVMGQNGCWIFTGYTAPGKYPYGQVRTGGRGSPLALAHRVTYEASVGPIPDTDVEGRRLVIDHLCRTPSCVRPDHLEVVTHQENLQRGDFTTNHANRLKTHCPAGHPYDDTNTRHHRGRRICRTCRRIQQRRNTP